jgi:hypothetical protein
MFTSKRSISLVLAQHPNYYSQSQRDANDDSAPMPTKRWLPNSPATTRHHSVTPMTTTQQSTAELRTTRQTIAGFCLMFHQTNNNQPTWPTDAPDQSIPHASFPMLTTGGGGNGRDVGVDHSINSDKLGPATAASARPPMPRPPQHRLGQPCQHCVADTTAWARRRRDRDGGLAKTTSWPALTTRWLPNTPATPRHHSVTPTTTTQQSTELRTSTSLYRSGLQSICRPTCTSIASTASIAESATIASSIAQQMKRCPFKRVRCCKSSCEQA